ncbi:AbrB family transcriptional regulator [Martelella alba]|uniref:AbrB family transcriptional regulator n=1 Tax=Martelella alba TaxID=2590451 RepID=A0ABY2SGU7_9HYPH|nr:AbrB family transcriptional regulator [Martelella alba]TKI04166.1 AbrB family transcriptional regulator [Martelella alba]
MKSLPLPVQWILLIVLSLLLGTALLLYHLPAALLMGPMLVAVTMGLGGATVRVSPKIFIGCQAVLGCMIALMLSPSILGILLSYWWLVIVVVMMTLLASGLSGFLLVKFSHLPGPTGAWGSSPGGASAMVAMSGEFGADVRLVAFMQYLRVLFVAAAAAIVAHRYMGGQNGAAAPIDWFPTLNLRFVATLVIAAAGAWLGRKLRIPAGALLVPMIIGAVLHITGTLTLLVPEWLLALAYAFIGWSVGLRFTPTIVSLAFKTLPQMVASIIGLILLCGVMAWLLTLMLPVDMLTAYLATSPGGLDTVAIIAAGSHADIGFVMALQSLRLLSILVLGPGIARFISRNAHARMT